MFVLGLIGGVALLAKKIGMGNRGPMRRSKGNRLSIIETMPLDAKRRVVLLRRDDKEHVILVGGVTELVIESGIPIDPDREKSDTEKPFNGLNLIDGLRHGLGKNRSAKQGNNE
jgi:flagellar protein FliO/FliZ